MSEVQANNEQRRVTENPDPTRCSYYLERKKRFCKTERVPCDDADARHTINNSAEVTPLTTELAVQCDGEGRTNTSSSAAVADTIKYKSIYCHMHERELASGYERATRSRKGLLAEALTITSGGSIPTAVTTNADQQQTCSKDEGKGPRIPCPINPNHSIYEKDLNRHVKVCPDLRHDASKLPYFCADLHLRNRLTKAVFGRRCNGTCSSAVDQSKSKEGYVETAVSSNSAATVGSTTATAITNTAHKKLSPEHLADLISRVKAFFEANVKPRLEDCTESFGDSSEEEEKEGDAKMKSAGKEHDRSEHTDLANVEATETLVVASDRTHKASSSNAARVVTKIKRLLESCKEEEVHVRISTTESVKEEVEGRVGAGGDDDNASVAPTASGCSSSVIVGGGGTMFSDIEDEMRQQEKRLLECSSSLILFAERALKVLEGELYKVFTAPSSSSLLFSTLLTAYVEIVRERRLLVSQLSQQRQASKKHGEQHDQLCQLIESGILSQRSEFPIHMNDVTVSSSSAAETEGTSATVAAVGVEKKPLWCVELGAGKAGLGLALHSHATEGNQDASDLLENLLNKALALSSKHKEKGEGERDAKSSHMMVKKSLLGSEEGADKKRNGSVLPFNVEGFIVADYGSFRHKADGKSKKKNTCAADADDNTALKIQIPVPDIAFTRARINVKDLELFECVRSFAKENKEQERGKNTEPSLSVGQKRGRDEDEEKSTCEKSDEKATRESFCGSRTNEEEEEGENKKKEKEDFEDFFVIGKHLCGACTDFSISSCFYGRGGTDESGAKMKNSKSDDCYRIVKDRCFGIAIATCCHQRCELQHYNYCEENSVVPAPTTCPTDGGEEARVVSKTLSNQREEHLPSFFNFTDEEAQSIISLTSWAVSGPKAVSEEQRQIGWICKRLIDYHRLVFIESVLRSEGRLYMYEGEDTDEISAASSPSSVAVAVVEGKEALRLRCGEAWVRGGQATPSSKTPKFRLRLVQYVKHTVTPENVALLMEPVL